MYLIKSGSIFFKMLLEYSPTVSRDFDYYLRFDNINVTLLHYYEDRYCMYIDDLRLGENKNPMEGFRIELLMDVVSDEIKEYIIYNLDEFKFLVNL